MAVDVYKTNDAWRQNYRRFFDSSASRWQSGSRSSSQG